MRGLLYKLVLVFALCLVGTLPVFAITIDELKQNAQNGDLGSQFQLGALYWQGRGVSQDYSAAFKWFEKAAKQGMPAAQSNIAIFYSNGWAVEQDYKKAVFWHKKAVAQGFAASQFQLSHFRKEGLGGLRKNASLALGLVKKAATGGHRKAQAFLGADYLQKKKYKEARKWFIKAAEQDDGPSQFMIGQFFQKGIGGKEDLEEAVDWFESAVGNNVVEAKFELASLIYQGKGGLEKDLERAFELYQEAAQANYLLAKFNVGVMYLEGIGTEKNQTLGLEWLEKAVLDRNVKAMFYLVDAYSKGKGVKQNYELAYQYILLVEGLGLKDKDGKIKNLIEKTKKPIGRALSKEQRSTAKMRSKELLAEIKSNQINIIN